jgi:hypothetical protein
MGRTGNKSTSMVEQIKMKLQKCGYSRDNTDAFFLAIYQIFARLSTPTIWRL